MAIPSTMHLFVPLLPLLWGMAAGGSVSSLDSASAGLSQYAEGLGHLADGLDLLPRSDAESPISLTLQSQAALASPTLLSDQSASTLSVPSFDEGALVQEPLRLLQPTAGSALAGSPISLVQQDQAATANRLPASLGAASWLQQPQPPQQYVDIQPALRGVETLQQEVQADIKAASQGLGSANEEIEEDVVKTEELASQLAKDASALSAELQKLGSALRGQSISPHTAQTEGSMPQVAQTEVQKGSMPQVAQAETMSMDVCREACAFRNTLGLRGCCQSADNKCFWHANERVDDRGSTIGQFTANCHTNNEGCEAMRPLGVCLGFGVEITPQGFTAPVAPVAKNAAPPALRNGSAGTYVFSYQNITNGTNASNGLMYDSTLGVSALINGTSGGASTEEPKKNSFVNFFTAKNFDNAVFTFNHKLSDFLTVVVWVAIFLVVLLAGLFTFRCLRRRRGGGVPAAPLL